MRMPAGIPGQAGVPGTASGCASHACAPRERGQAERLMDRQPPAAFSPCRCILAPGVAVHPRAPASAGALDAVRAAAPGLAVSGILPGLPLGCGFALPLSAFRAVEVVACPTLARPGWARCRLGRD